jgi:ethanolamine utilization protein EutN
MIICKVLGDIVSTVKNKQFKGKKILIVQPLDLENQPSGDAFLALDSVQAGVGDRVLVLREGGSARIVFNDDKIPIQAVITAVVDGVEINDRFNKDGRN